MTKIKKVLKPWGHEIWYAHSPRYAGKILVIEKGKRLSLQYHRVKHETVYVLKGRLGLTLGKKTSLKNPGSSIPIAPNTIHRLAAPKGRVTLLEVSTPELDDVVRLSDDYGRN